MGQDKRQVGSHTPLGVRGGMEPGTSVVANTLWEEQNAEQENIS